MQRPEGFTLIELLVAMAIMTLIGLVSWQVLSTVIRSREVSAAHLQRLDDLQRTLQLIRSDTTQIVQRPVSDPLGGMVSAVQPFLDGSAITGVEFTRTGWMNPMHELRSRLQRVRYQVRGEELHRLDWIYLDQVPGAQVDDLLLLKGVQHLQIRYLDSGYQWQVLWPEPMDLQKTPADQPLPIAIDFSFDSVEFGHVRLLLVLPGGLGGGNAV